MKTPDAEFWPLYTSVCLHAHTCVHTHDSYIHCTRSKLRIKYVKTVFPYILFIIVFDAQVTLSLAIGRVGLPVGLYVPSTGSGFLVASVPSGCELSLAYLVYRSCPWPRFRGALVPLVANGA